MVRDGTLAFILVQTNKCYHKDRSEENQDISHIWDLPIPAKHVENKKKRKKKTVYKIYIVTSYTIK